MSYAHLSLITRFATLDLELTDLMNQLRTLDYANPKEVAKEQAIWDMLVDRQDRLNRIRADLHAAKIMTGSEEFWAIDRAREDIRAAAVRYQRKNAEKTLRKLGWALQRAFGHLVKIEQHQPHDTLQFAA